MSQRDKCREYQEQFPMYFNNRLESHEAEKVKAHLDECPACRSVFAREQALFAMAGSDSQSGALDSHPDSNMLDRLARDPDSLEPTQRRELESHISECRLCRETVEKLAVLPGKLEALVTDEEIPTIAGLDRQISSQTATTTKLTDLTRRVWRPLTAFAAAAIVVFVAVTLVRHEPSAPTAEVEGLFPAMTRSLGERTIFETDTEEFTFKGRVYVDPEESHTYSIHVVDRDTDSLILGVDQVTDFDNLGFARFEIALRPGQYQLILYDIIEADSLEIVRPFEIQLKP
jgi:predicted anti-sigma-YlaC factor YlaD